MVEACPSAPRVACGRQPSRLGPRFHVSYVDVGSGGAGGSHDDVFLSKNASPSVLHVGTAQWHSGLRTPTRPTPQVPQHVPQLVAVRTPSQDDPLRPTGEGARAVRASGYLKATPAAAARPAGRYRQHLLPGRVPAPSTQLIRSSRDGAPAPLNVRQLWWQQMRADMWRLGWLHGPWQSALVSHVPSGGVSGRLPHRASGILPPDAAERRHQQ